MEANTTRDQDDALALLQQAYREVKRSDQELHLDDALSDLDIDSLAAIDMLSAMEETTGRRLIDQLTDELGSQVTVEDLVRELQKALAEGQPA